jgi:hypothetical protein
MSTSLKKLVRDRLVNDATMRGLLGATLTGSAPISPVYMERTAVDAQIIYAVSDAGTDPGMNSQNGTINFMIQVQATGGENPHIKYGEILNRISGLFDDQEVIGTGLTGTSVTSLLFLREGGPEVTYDVSRKFYTKSILYSFKVIGG